MNTLRFIVFILFFYFPKAQYASEAMHIVEHEMGYGARSLSMGGAFTALGDGPSGMYWNPAGLADIKNGSVYFESYNMYHNNNTSYLGESQANPFDISRVNGLGAVLPIPTIRGSLVFGIGFNRIHHYDALMSFSGFSNFKNGLEFPIFADGELFYYTFEHGVQRYEKIMSNGARDQLTFSFGIALSPNLAGGMSISRMNGLENYDFEFLQSDIADNFQEFPADFQSYELFQSLKTKTNAWKIRGGLKYIYSPFQFGLSIALPYNVNVDEVHATQERLIFDNAFKEDTIEVARYDYKVKMPSTIDFGAALVTDFNFSLSVGFRIQDWSQMQFDLIDFVVGSDEYNSLNEENRIINEEYTIVSQLRFGGEYLVPLSENFGVSARFGSAFIPSPKLSDARDTRISSFGLGIPIQKRIMLDIAYLYTFHKKTSNDSYAPSDVIEEIHKSQILFNLSYLF